VCVLYIFFWCNMLMCLFSIRGHKGLGFCQVRTEVIPKYLWGVSTPLSALLYFWFPFILWEFFEIIIFFKKRKKMWMKQQKYKRRNISIKIVLQERAHIINKKLARSNLHLSFLHFSSPLGVLLERGVPLGGARSHDKIKCNLLTKVQWDC
jgi:hypothetical protein